MKSLRFIGIAILAVFMSVGITACGDDNSQQIEEPNFISKNLHVKTAGDLSTLISDEELLNISELTLSGFINGTDVGYIQKMKNLTKIDLSNLHIVGGGNSYWGDGNNSHTWDNIFPEYFFENKPYLKEVKISNSVTKIGKYAFHDCPSLTSINIPNSVTVIGIRAFDGCTSLTSITIPSKVLNIKEVKNLSILNYKEGDFGDWNTEYNGIATLLVVDEKNSGNYYENIYNVQGYANVENDTVVGISTIISVCKR